MLVVCTIALAINSGGISVNINADVEGKLLKEDSYKYLVDFSKDLKRFDLSGKPSDYKKVLVNKTDCIKE
jgi:hypothetical protein